MIDLHDELVIALAGRYDIERELGHGGMAIVYLARDVKNHRRVALKVLRPELADALGAERFLQEVAHTAPLVHPNIIPLYDSGEAGGFLYYTMPFVEGSTLRDRLNHLVQLPIDDAIAIGRQVALALDYAHGHGVVHRDIKPENVLLMHDHIYVSDFGLARAITRSASRPLTDSGLVVGTVAYMSPEQCTPGGNITAATDIYSLGCLMFEMVGGMTPFRGATPEAMISHHLMSPPPSLREERSSCPSAMDSAVRRALAKTPADRFRSAEEFIRAIQAPTPIGYDVVDLPIEAPKSKGGEINKESRARRRRTMTGAGAMLLILIMLGLYTSRGVSRNRKLAQADTTRVLLLPVEGAAQLPLRQAAELVQKGVSRWRGVTFVNAHDTEDDDARRGRGMADEDARWLAVDRGAGRYMTTRLSRVGAELRLYSALSDVNGPRRLSESSVRLPSDLADGDSVVGALTDTLMLQGADIEGGDIGSRMLPAVQSYVQGRHALLDWNLARADSTLATAIEADPGFARAALWLAQTRSWRQMEPEQWLPFAERASASGRLSTREAGLARALLFLGRDRYSAACLEYDALIAVNEKDFAPWYGRGQCRRKDQVVVRDRASPSGWSFRSSYHQAAIAFARALELVPALHRGFQPDAFLRVRYLLFAGSGMVREGTSEGSQPVRFHAFPTWEADSLAFIPYSSADISAGRIHLDPASIAEAVRHQRELFARIARSWSAGLPKSAGPKEAVALSLELLGDSSALDSLRLARSFARDPAYALWLAVEEVFVQLEFARSPAQLDSVRSLADSLLNAHDASSGEKARMMAPIAALRGRCELATRFARADVPPSSDLPGHLRADFQALTLSSAMACAEPDYLVTANRLVNGAIAARPEIGAAGQRQLEISQLSRATALVFPKDSVRLLRLADESSDYLWRMQKAALVGDTAFVRAELHRIAVRRGAVRATTVSPDALYPEARLWIMLGDTATARRWLDAVLTSPGWLAKMLDDPVGVASLMRCFALRAEIASEADRQSRERWARIVATLWTHGDPGPSDIAASASRLRRQQ